MCSLNIPLLSLIGYSCSRPSKQRFIRAHQEGKKAMNCTRYLEASYYLPVEQLGQGSSSAISPEHTWKDRNLVHGNPHKST